MTEDSPKEPEKRESKINFDSGHYELEFEGNPSYDFQVFQEALNTISVARSWYEFRGSLEESEIPKQAVQIEEELKAVIGLMEDYGSTKVNITGGKIPPEEGLLRIQQKRERVVSSLGLRWPPEGETIKKIKYKKGSLWAESVILSQVTHDAKNAVNLAYGYVGTLTFRGEALPPKDVIEASAQIKQILQETPTSLDDSVEIINTAREPREISLEVLVDRMDKLNRSVEEQFVAQAVRAGIDEEIRDNTRVRVLWGEVPDVNNNLIYNPALFESLLDNAAQNSAKAAIARVELEEQGLVLSIEAHEFTSKVGKRYVEVVFTDNGKGLPKEVDRIDFVESKHSWDEEGKVTGTGLGMWALADLMKNHGIELFLQRRLDGERGAETVVRFPLAE